ncbi:hypothetical protein BHM03_00032523 [Ensete ventricosum]|nr:hypothetical protein BHM03_00032523 [Ensete ventricosum]
MYKGHRTAEFSTKDRAINSKKQENTTEKNQSLIKQRIATKEREDKDTDEWQDDEKDVEAQSCTGGDEEVGDGFNRDDDGSHGRGQRQLDGENRVDLSDERPPEIRALYHARVQRTRSAGLQVHALGVLRPHPVGSRYEIELAWGFDEGSRKDSIFDARV